MTTPPALHSLRKTHSDTYDVDATQEGPRHQHQTRPGHRTGAHPVVAGEGPVWLPDFRRLDRPGA